MIRFECTVQEGCVPDSLRPSLEAAIAFACHATLGPECGQAEFVWTVIPRGFGFRGGQPSTTSQVRGLIPDGCDRATRARLLTAIGDVWCGLTGASPDELMVAARDESWSG